MSGEYEHEGHADARYRIFAILRYHTQTLCISHHVKAYAKDHKIHVCRTSPAIGKLHFHLPRLEFVPSGCPGL